MKLAKKFWLYSVLILMIGIMIGCNSDSKDNNANSEDSEIDDLNFVYTGDPYFRTTIDNVLSSFSDEYPNINIKAESATDGSYSEYLRTKEATGEAPDFFELIDAQEYIDSDKLAEIPDEIAELVKNPVIADDKPSVLPRDANALGYIYDKQFLDRKSVV